LKPATVLIVEDDASLAEGLALNLGFEGHAVQVARDGAAGLATALRLRPDLVVLDLGLPGLDGVEVLRRLRAAGCEAEVIVLSARHLEADKVRALALGADDYVTKPFSLRELLARVEAALRRRRRGRVVAEARLRIGFLSLDPVARLCWRQGVPVEITARELDLLIFLAGRPERVWSRSQLLAAVWGEGYVGTERTVDNFVRRLRLLLEPDPAEPRHLRTVHGLGYRLVLGPPGEP
jgi:DNA-binding response OmpR family regulator